MDCKVATSLLLFLSLLYALVATGLSCPDTEREALLMFIGGLDGTVNAFSSWVGKDCCRWNGVGCDNITGHVTSLDLRGRLTFIIDQDMLNSSLLGLKQLNYLDLSSNYYQSTKIPEFICSFKELNHLNLSHSGLYGPVPVQFGNLSRLRTLDLSRNNLLLENASWISKLTSLHYLDLSSVSIGEESNWLQELNMLPSVAEIRLAGCVFGNFPLSLPHVNFTFLSVLDLSFTSINTIVPSWLFHLSNLQYLNLQQTIFHGLIPNSLSNFCKLRTLDLSSSLMDRSYLDEHGESFSGCIRNSLQELYLSSNLLSGTVPDWIGGVHNLKILDLSRNSLSGSVPDSLGRLSSLQILDISYNNLTGGIPEWLCNLPQLQSINLSNNSLSGELPNCTEEHTENLAALDLSNNNLTGGIPEWLCNLPQLQSINLSNNKLSGELPLSTKACTSLDTLDLSDNMLTGRIPTWLGELSSLRILFLASNNFAGEISLRLSYLNVQILDLSSNKLSGVIPWSFLNLYQDPLPFTIMNLSRNSLSGNIPEELLNFIRFDKMDLSNNNLTGQIPSTIGDLSFLDLSSNSLSGEIPSSLCNSYHLKFLNLSYNNLSGAIPTSCAFANPNWYVGNIHLCGSPLKVSYSIENEDEEESWEEKLLFWLITGVGFGVGFWAVVGTLLANASLRVRCFLLIDGLCNKIYVTTVVSFRRLKRKFAGSS